MGYICVSSCWTVLCMSLLHKVMLCLKTRTKIPAGQGTERDGLFNIIVAKFDRYLISILPYQ